MSTPDYLEFFPKETPYDNQQTAMERIYNAFTRQQNVLFEGACGTGKTLAALTPALSYARDHDKSVVITTNVHQQMQQFLEESREINAKSSINAVLFKGKAEMCHIDVGYEECQVLRETTTELVEAKNDQQELQQRAQELQSAMQSGATEKADEFENVQAELEEIEDTITDLENENICEFYQNNITRNTESFYDWLFDDVRTAEEVYEYAHEREMCGYELLKDGIEEIDLVICNYHHILDPNIRSHFFRWLGRDPNDIILVFDEAHNIEDTARDHARKAVSENTLQSALEELDDIDDPRAAPAKNVISTFLTALQRCYKDKNLSSPSIGYEWHDIEIRNENGRDDLTLEFLQNYQGRGYKKDLEETIALGEEIDIEYERAYKNGETQTRQECQTLQSGRLIQQYLAEGDKSGKYPVIGVRRDQQSGEIYGRAEIYTCIPREVTKPLFDDIYSAVLMSATLRPFDVVSDVLGIENPVTLAYELDFPEANRQTFAVDTPPLFADRRDDETVQSTILTALADAITYTAGNTLAYFPSYQEANRYYTKLDDIIDADRFLDEPETSAQAVKESFIASDNAVLCTSLWGTLTEGVSFDGDAAHSVVVVGVPYPKLTDRMQAVQDAYNNEYTSEDHDVGWRYAVEIPTIRKTRQAIGRVLRSPDEIGTRILLDRRYTSHSTDEMGKYSVYSTFPPAEREEFIDIQPEKLKYALYNFYSDHEAWDSEPPDL